jgi:hypothetical protein
LGLFLGVVLDLLKSVVQRQAAHRPDATVR